MKNRGMVSRPLALTAASTIALGGLFFATPAYAGTADEQDPLTTGQEKGTVNEGATPTDEIIEAAEVAEVIAFGANASGEDVVIVATEGDEPVDDDALKAFTDAADLGDAKVVTTGSAFTAYAEDDVVAGQGYIGLDPSVEGAAYACSIGFTGFSPEGDPALITAGHCAFSESDEKIVQTTLSVPGEDPAAGGPGFVLPDDPALLGEFGFAQFGGPNGSDGAKDDPNSTDIAVIDIDKDGGFNLLPEITDWTTAGDSLGSLADSTIPVRSVGAPTVGEVQKSGRTTGLSTGTIADDDILDGWAQVSGKWVRGFSSDVGSDHGDSGGAVFQGNKAVGVISGGNDTITWSTTLVYALEHTGGYTVALDIDAPKVSSPENGSTVLVGSTVTGTAPGAKVVRVSLDGENFKADLADGEFSFKAPEKPGEYTYKVTSTNGFSRSATTTYTLTTKYAPTAAPVITTPADGSSVSSTVTTVSGTGVAGAELVATIDGTDYTVTVDGGGNWAVRGLELSYGSHSISVVQTANDDTSDAATASFDVVPAAPAVTSITSGSTFAADNGPTSLSGTGIDGATVTVKLNGAEPTAEAAALAAESGTYKAEVKDGVWSIDFDAALESGSYTVSVSQAISGVSSAPTSLAFQVLVPAAPEPTEPPAPTTPPAPGGGGGAGDDGNLAATGSDMIVPLSASAGALVLLAGGITLLTLRRRKLIEG